MVTKFKDRSPEVSVSSGYNYKLGSEVEFNIDEKKLFKLTNIEGSTAWAEDDILDKKIISAMKMGNKLKVKAASGNGKYSIDNYSLSGFSKAYAAMLNCAI